MYRVWANDIGHFATFAINDMASDATILAKCPWQCHDMEFGLAMASHTVWLGRCHGQNAFAQHAPRVQMRNPPALPPALPPAGAYFDSTNLPAPRSRWGSFGAHFSIKIIYLGRGKSVELRSIITFYNKSLVFDEFRQSSRVSAKNRRKSTKNRKKKLHKTLIKKRNHISHCTLSSLSHEMQEIQQKPSISMTSSSVLPPLTSPPPPPPPGSSMSIPNAF